jgi:hypothetical protein
VVVERGDTAEVRRVDAAYDGTAAGAPAKGDETLHLEQSESLAQGLPADAVLLQHRRLGGKLVSRVKAASDDVVDEVPGDRLGGLERPRRPVAHRDVDQRSLGSHRRVSARPSAASRLGRRESVGSSGGHRRRLSVNGPGNPEASNGWQRALGYRSPR